MPITSTHPSYNQALPWWERCRTAVEGGDAVKKARTKYLPKLGGQDSSDYVAYLERALYYNASARTVAGYLGAIYRKPSETLVPAKMESWIKNVTRDGVALETFEQKLVSEVIQLGRYGVLVDYPVGTPVGGRPYLAGYVAESIRNWRLSVNQNDGRLNLVSIVLEESIYQETPDRFVPKKVCQYRELSIDENGLYRQDVWREDPTRVSGDRWSIMESFEPTIQGLRLKSIPFIFLGQNGLIVDVAPPPILDLVDVNLSHYRSSADLEHGRHWTALPTPWVAGFPETTKLKIGSTTAWVASDPKARAGMLEFTGQGLGALEKALEQKQAMMAVLGARLLEEQKRATEAADTVRLRQAAESSIIRQITISCSLGITMALRYMALYAGITRPEEVSHQINLDHFDVRMDAQGIQAMVQAWQAGAISFKSLFWNLQQGEILPPDADEETERQLIELQPPAGVVGMV